MKNARVGSILLVLALLFTLASPVAPVAQAQPAPSNQLTVSVYGASLISDATVNSAVPNVDASARDVSKTAGWTKADIFVTAAVSGTATLTTTVQFAPNDSNFANGYYEYWTGSVIGTRTYQLVQSASGTSYVTVPLAGENWRVSMTATGGVTTTVRATLRR